MLLLQSQGLIPCGSRALRAIGVVVHQLIAHRVLLLQIKVLLLQIKVLLLQIKVRLPQIKVRRPQIQVLFLQVPEGCFEGGYLLGLKAYFRRCGHFFPAGHCVKDFGQNGLGLGCRKLKPEGLA